MIKPFFNSKKIRACVQILFIYIWITSLMGTDAFLSVYLLCGVIGAFCMRDNTDQNIPKENRAGTVFLAALFGIATVLANYPLFEPVYTIFNMINFGGSILGGSFVAYHILKFMLRRFPLAVSDRRESGKIADAWVFLGCFACIAGVYLLYLFTTGYPVYLPSDGIDSMNQIRNGQVLNNHPYWYTQFIGLCLRIGWYFTEDNNASCAVYSAVQCTIMAACFAYALVTLYQAGIPRWCVLVTFVMYAFLPYHLTYSITMWKDTLFSGCALVLVTAVYRILKQIGRHDWLNYLAILIGGIGFCLIRHNGCPMLLAWMVFLLCRKKRQKKLIAAIGVVLLVGWIATHPLLDLLGVEKQDFAEVMAVPLQQIARVIAMDCSIAQQDMEILERIFYLDRVKELYSPEIVDPIKFDAMGFEGRQYIQDNMGQFLGLWLRLGVQNAGEYLKAWIELTKGYWNAGYAFWIYFRYTYPEITGIGGFVLNNPGKTIFDAIFRYWERPLILQPIFSIGFQTWTMITCCFVCAARKRQTYLISIPMVALAVGLWFVAPVYAEFRYTYPLFVTCPLILLTTLFSGEPVQEVGKESL